MAIIKTILTLTFILSMTALKAQDYITNNLKETVGYGCFYEGRKTKPVIKVTKLIESKRYKKIASLLNSENQAEKYLAVILLEKLSESGKYQLSENEMKLISDIKTSEKPVYVCSGCSFYNQVSLKTLFTNDMIGTSYWVDRVIKSGE